MIQKSNKQGGHVRLLGLDFETTGLNPSKDRVIELGASLWEVGVDEPIDNTGEYLYDETYPELSEQIVGLTGITQERVREFGRPPSFVFSWLEGYCKTFGAAYLVAHNGNSFDRPFLLAELDRLELDCPYLRQVGWIDTKLDIPFDYEPESRKLNHLLMEHGFINPFQHRAMFDTVFMMKMFMSYDIKAVLAYRAKKNIVIRAVVPHPKHDDGAGKDKAKMLGFRWQEANYKPYPGWWVKIVKEDQLEKEQAKLADYQVVKVEELVGG